jgi:hypothetical protein
MERSYETYRPARIRRFRDGEVTEGGTSHIPRVMSQLGYENPTTMGCWKSYDGHHNSRRAVHR